MTVRAVTPMDAARHPSHPDHARWVKDQTMRIEAEHARQTGATLRDAETANIAALARLEARQRVKKPKRRKQRKRKPTTPRNEEHARLAAAGVIKRPLPVQIAQPAASPCNWCGLCLTCKREARIRSIMARARQSDAQAYALTMELVAMAFAAQRGVDYKDRLGRELPFSRLRGRERSKATTTGAEWACDRSVSFMGEWR